MPRHPGKERSNRDDHRNQSSDYAARHALPGASAADHARFCRRLVRRAAAISIRRRPRRRAGLRAPQAVFSRRVGYRCRHRSAGEATVSQRPRKRRKAACTNAGGTSA